MALIPGWGCTCFTVCGSRVPFVNGERPLSVLVPFDSEAHEVVDQLRVGHPSRLPQLGIHADRGEAWQGVDFVHVRLAGAGFEEEIHPAPARRRRRLGRPLPPWHAGCRRGRHRCRRGCVARSIRRRCISLGSRKTRATEQSRQSLRLAVRRFLTRCTRIRGSPAPARPAPGGRTGTPDPAPPNRPDASRTLEIPHARSQVRRLDERRQPQGLQDAVFNDCRLPFPLVAPDEQVRHHGQAGRRQRASS